jgi:hypothetical protein
MSGGGLRPAIDDLRLAWAAGEGRWRDAARRDVAATVIEPLLEAAAQADLAMDELSILLRAARQACS